MSETAPELPPPPTDLNDDSRARWPPLAADVRELMGGADVDYLLLADLLRAQERLAAIRGVLDREGLVVKGSKGQTRPHPLLVSESVLRREVAQGIERLRLGAGTRHLARVDTAGRLVRRY